MQHESKNTLSSTTTTTYAAWCDSITAASFDANIVTFAQKWIKNVHAHVPPPICDLEGFPGLFWLQSLSVSKRDDPLSIIDPEHPEARKRLAAVFLQTETDHKDPASVVAKDVTNTLVDLNRTTRKLHELQPTRVSMLNAVKVEYHAWLLPKIAQYGEVAKWSAKVKSQQQLDLLLTDLNKHERNVAWHESNVQELTTCEAAYRAVRSVLDQWLRFVRTGKPDMRSSSTSNAVELHAAAG